MYFVVGGYGQGDETRPGVILGSLLLVPMTRAPILVAGWSLVHEMLFYLLVWTLIAVRGR